jgi:hypothetical protein
VEDGRDGMQQIMRWQVASLSHGVDIHSNSHVSFHKQFEKKNEIPIFYFLSNLTQDPPTHFQLIIGFLEYFIFTHAPLLHI